MCRRQLEFFHTCRRIVVEAGAWVATHGDKVTRCDEMGGDGLRAKG